MKKNTISSKLGVAEVIVDAFKYVDKINKIFFQLAKDFSNDPTIEKHNADFYYIWKEFKLNSYIIDQMKKFDN